MVGELVVAPHVELAVVLPVVGRNDDGRLLVDAKVLQILDQLADVVVRVPDARVVAVHVGLGIRQCPDAARTHG